MSTFWSLFIMIGTAGTLILITVFLLSNRQQSNGESMGHSFDGIEELNNPLPAWWVGMFFASIAFAVFYLILFPGMGNFSGALGWSSTGQLQAQQAAHDERFAGLYREIARQPLDEFIADGKSRQIGRRLFINHCSTCHGVTAKGAVGFPDLTDEEWIWGKSLETIVTTIEHGRIAAMPGWGAAMDETQLADLTRYIQGYSDGALREAMSEAQIASAQQSYNTFCVACHAADGTGNVALGAPDLSNDIWLYGSDAQAIAFTIRHGRNGNMPEHGSILGADKTRILAYYVLSMTAQAPLASSVDSEADKSVDAGSVSAGN